MIIQGMYGLGDNFYQRAIIRNLGECYLYTPWPEVYADLPVKCLKPQTQIRTQEKNINRGDSGRFHSGALGGRKIRLCYDQRGTIIEALEQSIGVKFERLDLSMPDLKKKRKPKILVRPCVVRSEWPASSRNCNPQYIQQAVDALKDEFTIVSIADLDNNLGIDTSNEMLSVARRYNNKSEFNYHYDDIVEEIFPHWFLRRQNILTCNFYFSDAKDYEGGDLKFTCSDKKYHTSMGDIIIFPSNWMFYHEVQKITQGKRYSGTVWLYYGSSKRMPNAKSKEWA